MKKAIIISLFITCSLYVYPQKGFRGYEWNTPRELIEAKEGKPTHKHPIGGIEWYVDSLINKEAIILYLYMDDKLNSGHYIITSRSIYEALKDFRVLEKILVDKYGYASDKPILSDSEIENLYQKDETYTIDFKENIKLKIFDTNLWDKFKTSCVSVVYSKPDKIKYSTDDYSKM